MAATIVVVVAVAIADAVIVVIIAVVAVVIVIVICVIQTFERVDKEEHELQIATNRMKEKSRTSL